MSVEASNEQSVFRRHRESKNEFPREEREMNTSILKAEWCLSNGLHTDSMQGGPWYAPLVYCILLRPMLCLAAHAMLYALATPAMLYALVAAHAMRYALAAHAMLYELAAHAMLYTPADSPSRPKLSHDDLLGC
eukprot:275926-Amorphochlora_amoeboformis.AAC.2